MVGHACLVVVVELRCGTKSLDHNKVYRKKTPQNLTGGNST